MADLVRSFPHYKNINAIITYYLFVITLNIKQNNIITKYYLFNIM